MKDEGIKSGDFVIPGAVLGVGEEFMPGEGAYEEEGIIHSSVAGIVDLDMEKRKASVDARTDTPPVPREGDEVICEIVDVRPQMALVELLVKTENVNRALSAPTTKGRVYIAHANKRYVTKLQNEFRIGDIIRARMRDTRKTPYELSTVGSELGVLLAYCTKCRHTLVKKGTKLECPACGSVETRNMASDYGNVKI
ncbi:MAG TPA: exosome complex RNA-binding protein Csl4 [Candidatus Methanofastidiosa archaeon]|nr:exosome complex RNA-binding protein Csl4 [Candidatus Methanofastidiosa archaeon]